MKRILLILMLCLGLVMFGQAAYAEEPEGAASGTCGENLTWELSESGVLTITGTGEMEDYTLDTEIGAMSPWLHSGYSKVIISEGVTHIGSCAFAFAAELTDITIPNSVTSIGYRAFCQCTGLREITIPDSVVSLGEYAFSGCRKLETVDLSDGLTSLEEGTFQSCVMLGSITIPDGVTGIAGAFVSCTNLRNVIIPDSVTDISRAFSNCTNLSRATVSKNMTGLTRAFAGCISLTDVTIQNGVTEIGSEMFEGCVDLRSITIPNSVTGIGARAFSGCSSLTSITIPDGVTVFENGIFKNCTSLEHVEIPDGLTTIKAYAFSGCSGLAEITIPESVTEIGSYAFHKCTSLTDLTVPGKVTSLEPYVFCRCEALKNVELHEGITKIDRAAFYACLHLADITIPDTVTEIGYEAFYNCSGLKQIVIPASVTMIGNRAFFGCSKAEAVTLPQAAIDSSVGRILNMRNKVKSITIQDGATSIGANAFERFGEVTSVSIPDSVTTIGESAFLQCSKLTDIVIPDSVTTIENGAFTACESLTDVRLSGSLETINGYMFNGCTALNRIVVPEGVTRIEDAAFVNTGLQTAAILNKDAFIHSGAFPHDGLVIQGYRNSTAETFASDYGLTFEPLPVVTGHPEDVIVVSGNEAVFSVDAVGVDLQYQWYYKTSAEAAGRAVSGTAGRSSVCRVAATAENDGWQYYCVVTDVGGSFTSDAATLMVVSDVPELTLQPKDLAVASTETATFKVKAGNYVTDYQWYYRTGPEGEWAAVKAASGKTAKYSLTTAARHNGYQYYCAVTNLCGTVNSDIATLTVVTAKPTIKTQPAAQTAVSGDTVTFRITASGKALQYQWYYRTGSAGEWAAVKAASGKTAKYSLTTAARHDGYQYRCVVKNPKGSVTSSTVKLTVVTEKPTITVQPKAVTVVPGDSVKFKVSASGAALSYQWYYRIDSSSEWKAVSAASGKTAAYSLTAEARHNGYLYKCVVKNLKGSVTSSVVKLTVVSSKPVIKTQPKAQTAASGDTVTFKIAASGTALTYQWYYRVGSSEEWMAVTSSGGKTASYSLTAASRHNGYQYMCIVKNLKGSVTSSVVKLTVVAAKPVIITQPKAVTVSAGNKATFKVVANGNGLKYQWYYRTDSSVEWKAVSAASGKTAGYSLTAEARHNGYQYKCVVENLKGSVTSSIVRLTVK